MQPVVNCEFPNLLADWGRIYQIRVEPYASKVGISLIHPLLICDHVLRYLVQIFTACVYDVAQESPLELAPNLSTRLHNKLLLNS
jgi:hypothetical protein